MKLLFDFFPIVLFFLSYKFFGIFVATGVVIAVSFLQVLIYWLKYRRVDGMLIATCVLVTILGSITLLSHNEIFIKWKPTVIYWLFSLCFFASQFVGKKSIIERMLDGNIELPKLIWKRLNLSWVFFFFLMGVINIYIIYHFSTDTWVNFKLFGIIGLTVIFIVIQAIFLSRYIQEPEEEAE